MRIVNFRDDVLWAIAYRLGLDPEVSLLKNQAYALASYVNAYVRRLYDASDWPEWTVTGKFSVDQDSRNLHNVSWNATPSDYLGLGPEAPAAPPPGLTPVPMIGKVLKVYLVDPRSTWAPVDTPFRLGQRGIHVGFEHGPSVWIKYVPRCPQFTAREWDATVTYGKDALTYSPVSGECYKSKTSNNLGHDPSVPGGGPPPTFPPMVEETPGAPVNPGLSAKTEIVDIFSTPAAPTALPIPDPPVAGTVFTIVIHDAADAFLGDATHTASGSESLATIFTNLQGQLAAEALMSTFTVTLVTTPQLKITLENASQFSVFKANYTVAIDTVQLLPLKVAQTQAYVAATAPAPGIGQTFKLTITDDQVVIGSTYTLTFTTVDSAEHVAAYVALASDGAVQILNGLINNVIALQSTDDFFTAVTSTLDTVGPSATFTLDKTVGIVSLHADIMQVGSTFWDLVPFPFALVDQVVRGAYADALAEGGQTDKAAAQEGIVPQEAQVAVGKFDAPQFDQASDQQKPTSRYAIK